MKKMAWVKKHEDWTLDQWNSVLKSDSKLETFGSTCHVLFEVQKKVSSHTVSHCEALRGMCDDMLVILLVTILMIYSIQDARQTYGTIISLEQQDNDPTPSGYKDSLTKEKSHGVQHQMTWSPQSPP